MLRFFFRRALLISILALPLVVGADCMGPYPPSMVRAFNQNCATDKQAFCTCLMDEVQKTIPLADFIEIGNTPGGIDADPRFIKASTKCSALLTGGTAAPNSAKAPAAQATPATSPPTQPNPFKSGTSWGPNR